MASPYSAVVPGKIMLAGEYTVLYGGRAIACTVGCHLKATVQKTQSTGITIGSGLWGRSYPLTSLPSSLTHSPLATTSSWANENRSLHGADIWIDSNIRVEDGFGSSSALRLALLLAIEAYHANWNSSESLQQSTLQKIAETAWQLQKLDQSAASGYDVATQMAGGCLIVQPTQTKWPGICRHIHTKSPSWLRVMRGGKGAPTGPILKRTKSWLSQDSRMDSLFSISEQTIDAWQTALDSSSSVELGHLIPLIAKLRKCFEPAPDFPKEVHRQLQRISDIDITWSYKTTGAGGEDALLLIGWPDSLRKPIYCLKELGWQELTEPLMVAGAQITCGGDTE